MPPSGDQYYILCSVLKLIYSEESFVFQFGVESLGYRLYLTVLIGPIGTAVIRLSGGLSGMVL